MSTERSWLMFIVERCIQSCKKKSDKNDWRKRNRWRKKRERYRKGRVQMQEKIE